MEIRNIKRQFLFIIFVLAAFVTGPTIEAKGLSKSAHKSPVKLIFIHHSCGENWLNDDDGGLGRALGKNNYFVSDTNYGWGPSNIGDRTDIVNWTEWFSSSKTAKYMNALLSENNKHSSYTRNISDPGGNNRIIMFKSCFPNSELKGSPEDSPKRGGGLTIANAKAIYNKLLSYFAKHPELLFIAITAPPVQSKSFSKNARAFNNWLTYDWLKNYKGYNVVVYDFYNTLTGPDNHHRINKNIVEHVYQQGKNTLYYASAGDDHPLAEGNRKAVREFVPLLNMFYNNFMQKVAYAAPKRRVLKKSSKERQNKQKGHAAQVGEESRTSLSQKSVSNIADFDGECSEWTVFSDTNKATQIRFKCELKKQARALKVEYNISNDSWGTCSLVYPSPVSWKAKKGISFYILAKSAGQKINFIVYQGKGSDDLHHFEMAIKTDKAMTKNWRKIKIPWSKLKRPSWEGSLNDRLDLNFIQGVALGFDDKSNNENNNKMSVIWIDKIKLY
jgi:hypothetical protein